MGLSVTCGPTDTLSHASVWVSAVDASTHAASSLVPAAHCDNAHVGVSVLSPHSCVSDAVVCLSCKKLPAVHGFLSAAGEMQSATTCFVSVGGRVV